MNTYLFVFIDNMAEREGFEPSVRINVHTLSRRAPSATRTPLRKPIYRATELALYGILARSTQACSLLRGYEIHPVFPPLGQPPAVQIPSFGP